MRVLILLRDAAPNGITTYNRVLARALREEGHDVLVWPDLDTSPSFWAGALQGLWLRPAFERLLRPVVERFAPDVVYVSHFTQACLAQRLQNTLGVPWVACMHNGHSPARMAQWAQLVRHARGLVTMCETLHVVYAPMVQAAPCIPQLLSRLPLAVPTAPLATRASARRVLTYCARLSSQKGPRCEAWLRAIASQPDLRACDIRVIGGGRYLARLRQVAAELGLEVDFVGMVSDPTPYLDRTHVIAGAGYALMEGLVRGGVGIGLGFGGCWGVVTPQRWDEALAVNFGDHCPYPLPDDPDTIAQALSEALAMVGSADAVAVTARCRAVFDPAPIARDLVDFWGKALRPAA
ncbi:MAG: glycosyltransferase [Burkholderiaceae bacterium]